MDVRSSRSALAPQIPRTPDPDPDPGPTYNQARGICTSNECASLSLGHEVQFHSSNISFPIYPTPSTVLPIKWAIKTTPSSFLPFQAPNHRPPSPRRVPSGTISISISSCLGKTIWSHNIRPLLYLLVTSSQGLSLTLAPPFSSSAFLPPTSRLRAYPRTRTFHPAYITASSGSRCPRPPTPRPPRSPSTRPS